MILTPLTGIELSEFAVPFALSGTHTVASRSCIYTGANAGSGSLCMMYIITAFFISQVARAVCNVIVTKRNIAHFA